MERFLTELQGSMVRLPIIKGTSRGDKDIQNSVAEFLTKLISDHNNSIGELDHHSRSDRLEGCADTIKSTRVKIEAYASYLGQRQKELLEELDKSEELLTTKI